MGIFTDKFIKNFNENASLNSTRYSTYDIGAELCNISSLALNECMNRQSLLESAGVDLEQQRILEAQIDVLLEFSVKDIWEKIKSFFKWIWEQIKKLGRWIKGLFTKGKGKETEKNINTALAIVNKSNIDTQIQEDRELLAIEEKIIRTAKNATENILAIEDKEANKSVDSVVVENIKKELDKTVENKKRSIALLFYSAKLLPSLYYEPKTFINDKFASNTSGLISKFSGKLDEYKKDSRQDSKINRQIESLFDGSDMFNYMSLSEEIMKKYDMKKAVDMNKDQTEAKINPKGLNKLIEKENVLNMEKESKKIQNFKDLLNWMDTRVKIISNNDIKVLEKLNNDLSAQTTMVEKTLNEKIKDLSNGSSSNTRSATIKFLSIASTDLLFILRFNATVLDHLQKNTFKTLNRLNSISAKFISLGQYADTKAALPQNK